MSALSLLARFAERLARPVIAARRRAQVRRLADLDDHVLRDIGLTRADVQAALLAPRRRDPWRQIKALCCGGASMAPAQGCC